MSVLYMNGARQIRRINSLWYFHDGDLATVGIDWSTRRDTSEVFCIDFPDVDEFLYQGIIFCCVYTLAETHTFMMPFNGRIVAVNTVLETNPRVVMEDQYNSGWLIKVLGQ